MQHLCARCHFAVSRDDDGTLVFCPHCGAPQVWLSAEVEERVAADRASLAEAAASGEKLTGAAASDPTLVDWRGGIQCAGIAGLVAMALALVSLPLASATLLSLLWAMGAPVVMLGVYASRYPRTRILPGFGARLGVLCGIAVGLGSTAVNVAALVIERAVVQHPLEADTAMNAQFAQLQTTLAQNPGAGPWVGWLTYPETRAGMFLAALGLFGAAYLVFSAAGGAFAGLLRARKDA